ncbi:hypothetical protein HDV04_004530 [Boothiomyces sp. JEL0838]|nr:hypothetical protein HDV04_004530 [Boothiomyces sp. JEL0838]
MSDNFFDGLDSATHPAKGGADEKRYRACDRCRQRKRGCDGQNPCSNCVINSKKSPDAALNCVYSIIKQEPAKSNQPKTPTWYTLAKLVMHVDKRRESAMEYIHSALSALNQNCVLLTDSHAACTVFQIEREK